MSTQQSSSQQPQTIELNVPNTQRLLSQFVELAQSKGAYFLNEASLLKRALDVLLLNVSDAEINESTARSLVIQGVQKGQKSGAYTLNDAAVLDKLVTYLLANSQVDLPQQPEKQGESSVPVPSTPTNTTEHAPVAQPKLPPAPQKVDEDITELTAPVPLVPKEI